MRRCSIWWICHLLDYHFTDVQISPRLQTKTVANSLTLWSILMVRSILNIYETLRAKIPYLKAPLSSLHCSSWWPPQLMYISLIQLHKTKLQIRTFFPYSGMLNCWIRNMFRKWFLSCNIFCPLSFLKMKTNRIRRITMSCVPILLSESHGWFSWNCV